MVVVRSWEVSTNDVNNNFRIVNSVGWFPFTLPNSYTPGGQVDVSFNGGLFSSGMLPEAMSCFISAAIVTTNDLPPHSVALSASKLTWAIGGHWKLWLAGSPSWSLPGTNPTLTVNIPGANTRDYTLIDGAPGTPSIPNEGCYVNTGENTPYGWGSSLNATANDHPPGTYQLAAGQAVEVQFFFQVLPNDNTNPARGVYAAATSITVTAGGVDIPIPLTSVTVGFGIGAQSVPWPAWPFGVPGRNVYGVPWYPHRPVSFGLPNIAGGGSLLDDGYQDVFLQGGGTSQGLIF